MQSTYISVAATPQSRSLQWSTERGFCWPDYIKISSIACFSRLRSVLSADQAGTTDAFVNTNPNPDSNSNPKALASVWHLTCRRQGEGYPGICPNTLAAAAAASASAASRSCFIRHTYVRVDYNSHVTQVKVQTPVELSSAAINHHTTRQIWVVMWTRSCLLVCHMLLSCDRITETTQRRWIAFIIAWNVKFSVTTWTHWVGLRGSCDAEMMIDYSTLCDLYTP